MAYGIWIKLPLSELTHAVRDYNGVYCRPNIRPFTANRTPGLLRKGRIPGTSTSTAGLGTVVDAPCDRFKNLRRYVAGHSTLLTIILETQVFVCSLSCGRQLRSLRSKRRSRGVPKQSSSRSIARDPTACIAQAAMGRLQSNYQVFPILPKSNPSCQIGIQGGPSRPVAVLKERVNGNR